NTPIPRRHTRSA
nr:Chain F, Fibroblast growth factor 23 [Homo sapiens]